MVLTFGLDGCEGLACLTFSYTRTGNIPKETKKRAKLTKNESIKATIK